MKKDIRLIAGLSLIAGYIFFVAVLFTPLHSARADIYNPGSGSGSSSGVTSINNGTGTYSIVAGTNITISTTTNSTTINGSASSGGGSGNVTVSPSSSVIANNLPFYTTSGSSTLSATSSASISGTTLTIGGAQSSTIDGNASNSYIYQLNKTIALPEDFATNGCAGSSTATTFQGCIAAIIAQQKLVASGTTVWVTKTVTSTWTNTLDLGTSGFYLSLRCNPGVQLKYTGAANSPFAIVVNNGDPAGHLVSEFGPGCTFMGQSSLIAAAQTNTATTTGLTCGGTNGCVGYDFHDFNINGFGRNIAIATGTSNGLSNATTTNAYMLSFRNFSTSGGNCGGSGMTGCLIFVGPAHNSGERNVFDSFSATDPGNSTSGNAIYISDAAVASNFFSHCSIDDAQSYIGFSNGLTTYDTCHIENAAYATYGQFIPFYATSSAATNLVLDKIEFANDANAAGTSFATLVKHGVNFRASNIHIDNYGGQTITTFADHSLNNGSESEYVTGISVQGGALTNIVNNQAYSQAVGASWVTTVANSFPYTCFTQSTNVAVCRNGNAQVYSVDQTGNTVIGIPGTSGSLQVQGAINATGSITASTNLSIGGTALFKGAATVSSSLSVTGPNGLISLGMTSTGVPLQLGTTTAAAIGGASLALDACTSTTSIFPYVLSTSTDIFVTQPQVTSINPAIFSWGSFISSVQTGSSTVTTQICAELAAGGTPTSTKFNVSVMRVSGM